MVGNFLGIVVEVVVAGSWVGHRPRADHGQDWPGLARTGQDWPGWTGQAWPGQVWLSQARLDLRPYQKLGGLRPPDRPEGPLGPKGPGASYPGPWGLGPKGCWEAV